MPKIRLTYTADCRSEDFYVNESLMGNYCYDDCDCDGARTCDVMFWFGSCSGTSRTESSSKPKVEVENTPMTFTGKNLRWYVQNDTVMGGRSSSQIKINDEGEIQMTGNVNTNGGGFATMRSSDRNMGISQSYKGFKVTYRGATANKVNYKFGLSAGSRRLRW